MRLGLAEAAGRSILIAQREREVVSLAGTLLPNDPLAILLDPSLRRTAEAAVAKADAIDPATLRFLPPMATIGKIICVGLNYADHAAESPYDKPKFPVFFLRTEEGVIGHGASIVRPQVSEQLVEKTKGLENTQQESIDQLQVVQDQLQTVRRLLAAQQAETKKLSEQVSGLAEAVDGLRQSFASAQASEPSGSPSVRKTKFRAPRTAHRKPAKSRG